MKSKNRRKSDLEELLTKAKLRLANERIKSKNRQIKHLRRLNHQYERIYEFNRIITGTGNHNTALDLSLNFLQEEMKSKLCEIKVYTPQIFRLLQNPAYSFNTFMNEDINMHTALFDIRTGFEKIKKQGKLDNILKETMYMCCVGKEPIQIDDPLDPHEYVHNHAVTLESIVRENIKTNGLSKKEFELIMTDLKTYLHMHYDKERFNLDSEDSQFVGIYNETLPKLVKNIDFKIGRSEGRSYYTCPIIIKDDKGNKIVIGDVHVNLDRPIEDEEVDLLYQLISSASGSIRTIRRLNTDRLTGLYNMDYFKDFVKKEAKTKRPTSCLFLDIDKFKIINDTYGHNFGDQAIIKVSEIITNNCGGLNVPIRYAGDEFLVLFPNTKIDDAYNIANTIRENVETLEMSFGRKKVNFTISGGVCCSYGKNTQKLIKFSDKGMYKAKEGRNKICKYKLVA